jgi:hypothetical protein
VLSDQDPELKAGVEAATKAVLLTDKRNSNNETGT